MTDDNVRSIQPRSLNAKRQALNLLAQHAGSDSLTEAVIRLTNPATDEVLAEALKPLVQYADEKLGAEEKLGEAIGIVAGDDNLAEDYIVELREALELLAQHATAKQLHAAILACVATPERLDAAINAYTEDDEPDDNVNKPLRAVG
jgi:hypothetical protein